MIFNIIEYLYWQIKFYVYARLAYCLCSVTQQTAFCKILFFFFFHIINDNVMGLLQHYKTDDYQTCFDYHIFLLTLIRTKRKVHSNTNYKQAGQIHRPFHGHYSFKICIKYKNPVLWLWLKSTLEMLEIDQVDQL